MSPRIIKITALLAVAATGTLAAPFTESGTTTGPSTSSSPTSASTTTTTSKFTWGPKPTPGPRVGEEHIINFATYPIAVSGALDMATRFSSSLLSSTTTTVAAGAGGAGGAVRVRDTAPQVVTFNIYNRAGHPVHTQHARSPGSPPAIGGDIGPGVIPDGGVAAFVIPREWAGNIAVVADGLGAIKGDESLLEGSFVRQGGDDHIIDIDVPFVAGFSEPITCSCESRIVTGCNKNLWALNECPDCNLAGSCRNPTRAAFGIVDPTAFFLPCRGAAYTFPDDHQANANGDCFSGTVDCCIGIVCSPNPDQTPR